MSLLVMLVIGLAVLIMIGGVVLLLAMLSRTSTQPAAPVMAPPPAPMAPPPIGPPGYGPTPEPATPDAQWAQLEQGASAIAASQGKIAAIKWVREQTGLGLAEAKHVVDRLT